MAFFKILYWQDIPAQVKAWDAFDEISVELSPRFTARIDQVAGEQGLTQSDDYLAQWHWTEEEEREGAAGEVAEAVRQLLEDQYPR